MNSISRSLPRLLVIGCLIATAVHSAAAENPHSPKKGWAGGKPDSATAMNCSWYYNWTPGGTSRDGLEFVPMIKTHAGVRPKVLERIQKSGAKVLLGFNEPERTSQGNTSVEQALELWPRLMATGLRLGSPAPSSDRQGMAWLERFMKGVEQRKLRVDFIAVHYYRSADAGEFEKWLDELYRKYQRPIWVTEFNAKFTKGDRDQFARESFKMLARHRHVERFAYMNGFVNEPGAIFKDGKTKEPTRTGMVLRDL